MRALLIAILLSSATAGAQSIYPNGGPVPQTPTLWISTTHMPSVEVLAHDGPVVFELDESPMERGLRRIALSPHVADGPFTVILDGRRIEFQADAQLDNEQDEDRYSNVDFTRVAIERVRGRETLVIEAAAEQHTILYFLNHSSPRANAPGVFARYTWSGPGRRITADTDVVYGLRRFEVPLADLGVSCASTRTIEISPYTMHMSGSTTLHAIAKLAFANGKVALPVKLIGDYSEVDEWLPCIGASATAHPHEYEHASAEAPQQGAGILYSPTGFHLDDLDPELVRGGLLGPSVVEHRLALPPAMTPSIDGVSGDETELVWWTAPLALFGIALAMWRATTRAAV